jgi:hypothetical protein
VRLSSTRIELGATTLRGILLQPFGIRRGNAMSRATQAH